MSPILLVKFGAFQVTGFQPKRHIGIIWITLENTAACVPFQETLIELFWDTAWASGYLKSAGDYNV